MHQAFRSHQSISFQERREQNESELTQFLGPGKPLLTYCTVWSSQQLRGLTIRWEHRLH